MNPGYLEITYRHGRPLAAYLYLPRKADDYSERTEDRGGGLLVDYAPDGRAIGIELTNPESVTVDQVNRILHDLDAELIGDEDLRPLALAG